MAASSIEGKANPTGGVSHGLVCRVAGASFDTLRELRGERTLRQLSRWLAARDRLLRLRDELAALLYDVIGRSDGATRRHLIALRRDVFNLRDAGSGAELLLRDVEPVAAAAMREWVAQREAVRTAERELARELELELPLLRHRFRGLLGDADFRKGLAISTPSLFDALEQYRAAGDELRARDEKAERALLRYYTRMAAKATPFSTFCTILPGRLSEPRPGANPPRVIGHLGERHSHIRINKGLCAFLLQQLERRPAVRGKLLARSNSTTRLDEQGRLVFLTALNSREVYQRLAPNPVLDIVNARLARTRATTFGDLVDAISADSGLEATRTEAEAYLDRLVEIGFLHLDAGLSQQDADWDLPLRRFLEGIDDEHAAYSAVLLRRLREQSEAYATADAEMRVSILKEMREVLASALEAMGIPHGSRADLLIYEDVTAGAELRLPLTDSLVEAFQALEEWVRLTCTLAWPRAEQATMRAFYDRYYGPERAGVPLLQFYEDFHREHFKSHLEKVAAGGGVRVGDYDPTNPFVLEFVRRLREAEARLARLIARRWAEAPTAEVVDLDSADIAAALVDCPPAAACGISVAAFVNPALQSDGRSLLVLHEGSYATGFGKFFSRFLYMLPQDLLQEVRLENRRVSRARLAEICGDADFNANLHPPLLPWEISYPTGASGAGETCLPSSELLVERQGNDAHALCLRHAPSGREVRPVDLGFLNPRRRPALYQLLSRFAPPATFSAPIPSAPLALAAGTGPGNPPVPDGQGAPPARISVRPRVTFRGCLVLARRRWSVPGELFPQRRPAEAATAFFLRVNAWRSEHAIPQTVYMRIRPKPQRRVPEDTGAGSEAAPETPARRPRPPRFSSDGHKPQFIDFASPLLVLLMGRMAGALTDFTVIVEEQLPDRDSLPRHRDGAYAAELILQLSLPESAPMTGQAARNRARSPLVQVVA